MGHMTRLFPGIQKAATFTTRASRPGERPGIDYHFITPEAFQAKVESGEIYEFTRTYGDYLYGSPRRLLETDEAAPLLVELEVKGMLRLKAATRRRLVSVFVLPPDLPTLRTRILARYPESNVEARLEKAVDQIEYALAYDYVLVNDDPARFEADLSSAIRAELIRAAGIERARLLSEVR